MGILERARRVYSDPIIIPRELNCILNTRGYRRDYNTKGENLVKKDWDYLTILDSCRYDTFREQHDLPGKCSKVTSRSSGTGEFLRSNFHNEDLSDTVYVTANPMLYRKKELLNTNFHDIVNIWLDDGWDEECGTVMPETAKEFALKAAESYPNKRLIIHFLQPHRPFIGETADKHEEFGEGFGGDSPMTTPNVPRDVYMKAYKENLRLTLPYVHDILSELEGKHVVSADHGQLIGDRSYPIPFRDYGHWRGNYAKELVEVPWHTYLNGTRPNITKGRATDSESFDDNLVSERLKDLGYA